MSVESLIPTLHFEMLGTKVRIIFEKKYTFIWKYLYYYLIYE